MFGFKMMERRKILWLSAALIVALVAIVETAATWLFAGPPAKKEGWDNASKYLRKSFKKGDLLLFAPAWIGPTGRMHMGELLDIHQMARPDEAAFSRIWIIGLEGKTRPETKKARLVSQKVFGNIQVSLFENKTDLPLFDFYENVSTAQVNVLRPDGSIVERCPFQPSRHRHQCSAGWNNVRQKIAEVDYSPRKCIYAHPVDGNILEINYPKVKLGKRLVIYTGIDGYDSRYKARQAVYHTKNPKKRKDGSDRQDPRAPRSLVDVTMEVEIGTVKTMNVTHPIDDKWRRHVLDTSNKSEKIMTVSFRVFTRWPYAKVFCFYAQTRE